MLNFFGKGLGLISILFFLFHSAPAQSGEKEQFIAVDQKIKILSNRQDITIDSVISFVNRKFRTDREKIRAYYTFIATNIDYDIQRLDELIILPNVPYNFEGPLHYSISQDPVEVFKKRKGVCEGLSRLMVMFCDGSGIPSYMVAGYVKSPEGDVITNIGHAWNAVKVDSSWALMDITWSNGYVNEKREFVRRFSDNYFLVDPEIFIEDHLPMEPMWQLKTKPVSKKYFFRADSLEKYYADNYNYSDSIQKLFKKNGYERNYQTLLNYYKYDKEDANYARNLDIYLNNMAANKLTISNIYFDDFINFYNSTLRVRNTKANCKKALEMLSHSQKELKEAQNILKVNRAYTPEFEKIFKEMNTNILKNNQSINKNIQLVKQLQKQAIK